jgi:putative hydrolases of HD superfamily
MAMMSFMVTDPAVNRDRLMKVCMVHDLAEAIIGDITPHDGVSLEDKHAMEEVSFQFAAVERTLTDTVSFLFFPSLRFP